MKKLLLAALMVALAATTSGCGKSEELKNYEGLVKEIGEVTLEDKDAIKAAEDAYAALTEEDKQKTKKNTEVEEARATYEQLVKDAEVAEVIKAISEMGEVTFENREKIDDAKKAYDKLPSDSKEKVINYQDLTNAIEQLKTIKAERAESLLSVLKFEEDRVRSLKFYYPSTMKFYSNGSWAADLRCFVHPYIGRDNTHSWLRIIYNYTADDWVFFDSLIIAVDGEQYNRSFKYFDVVRDNESGDVWEYIDVEASDSDIDMLWAIANSQETIIRFQGKEYSSDYVVQEADKQGIREILSAYEALN